MSTDLARRELVIPGTPSAGLVIDVADTPAWNLTDLLGELADLETKSAAVRQAIVEELAARADRRGARKVTLDGVELEVNAPTEEVYDVRRLREELEPLVADGVIDRELVAELIVRPTPPEPPERVDKRRVNTLKRSADKRVLAALTGARTVVTRRRTVKVLGRPVDGTVEEVSS